MDPGYIREACSRMNSRIVEWRRQFHRIPELGTELPETAALVRKLFSDLGVEVQESYQGIGVVGLIHGEKGGGPTVAVRADMDALEIEEQAGREYGSRHPGRMHACGHDAHMAIALGAADFLARNKERFRGRLKLIFQPGEESMLGALRMVEAGALENPKVDFLLGLHIGNIWEEVGLGQIGVCSKPVMAAADTFEFTIEAQGGHGAAPHTSPDPVLAASQAVIQLHTLIGRELDPVDPAVITVGQIQGGQAANIIPTAVRAKGTVRTLSEKVRDFLETRMAEVVSHTAAGYRCGHRFTYHRGSPVVKSDPEVTDLVAGSARELFGAGGVCRIEKPAMVGEDVSFFLREVPGCFFALGSSNPEKGFHSLHHSPLFDIDESVLWRGTAVFILAALRLLEGSVSQAEQRGRLQS